MPVAKAACRRWVAACVCSNRCLPALNAAPCAGVAQQTLILYTPATLAALRAEPSETASARRATLRVLATLLNKRRDGEEVPPSSSLPPWMAAAPAAGAVAEQDAAEDASDEDEGSGRFDCVTDGKEPFLRPLARVMV